MRVFYMCDAGGSQWPCMTVIESDAWVKLHKDVAWKPGQRCLSLLNVFVAFCS